MDSFREQFEKHVTHDSIEVNGIRLHYVFAGKEDAPRHPPARLSAKLGDVALCNSDACRFS